MIAIPGKHPMGNVLHLIVGPESELVMDIQGSQLMDISKLVNEFNQSEALFVSITRSRSEAQTAATLRQSEITHVITAKSQASGSTEGCDGDCKTCKAAQPPRKSKAKATLASNTGVCSYCKRACALLPIAGFKICASCAQIELGMKQKKEEVNAKIDIKP